MKPSNIETIEFHVKGMICSSCLKLLNNALIDLGAQVLDIQLGKIAVAFDRNVVSEHQIREIIEQNEFDIITEPKSILAEKTKRWIINYVWNEENEIKIPDYLSDKLNRPYYILSRNFSKVFKYTIKNYEQKLKVERIKEKIEIGNLSFSEIAYDLGYHHLSALSRLFKNHTGMSLVEYKSLSKSLRIPIDKI
ncbi:MAG: AraC family transcriptional regulator [Crocinitomix sp.]|jgi:AraC family transcriptional regulator